MKDSICIIDFCGRCGYEYPFQYWAFWFPREKLVKFGGELRDVPDMAVEFEPTEEQCFKWVFDSGYKFPI